MTVRELRGRMESFFMAMEEKDLLDRDITRIETKGPESLHIWVDEKPADPIPPPISRPQVKVACRNVRKGLNSPIEAGR